MPPNTLGKSVRALHYRWIVVNNSTTLIAQPLGKFEQFTSESYLLLPDITCSDTVLLSVYMTDRVYNLCSNNIECMMDCTGGYPLKIKGLHNYYSA